MLLHYAPNSDASALVAAQYNDLVSSLDYRQVDAALAGAITTGLVDNQWPWSEPKMVHEMPNGPIEHLPERRRRQVWRHIAQAFENLPVGTELTVIEISHRQTDEYGSDGPSYGAISALLTNPGGEGLRYVEQLAARFLEPCWIRTDAGDKLGVRKTTEYR